MFKGKAEDKVIYGFYIYFILYAVLSLVNLTYIPVAWVDETYSLDPAIEFLKTGKLASKVWHNPGTEKFIFAYLPFLFFLEIGWLSIFPWEMFFVRLPYVLFFFGGMFCYYKVLKDILKLPEVISLLVIFLFINDKATSEAVRSVRVESFELFFIPFILYRILSDKNDFLNAVFLSMLFLCHPKSGMFVVILGIFILFRQKTIVQKGAIAHGFLFLIVLYLYMGNFDFVELYNQLIAHADEHNPDKSYFSNFFINRFWPFYTIQPYIPFIFYASVAAAAFNIYKKWNIKECLIEICYISSLVYWYFSLGGFPRYNPVVLIFSYMTLATFLYERRDIFIKFRRFSLLSVLLVPVVCFPFLSRHAAAFLQRNERDINGVLNWYALTLGKEKGKVLLIGESSGHYYSLKNPHIDFSTFYSISKFNPEVYTKIYVSSIDTIKRPDFKLYTVYSPPQFLLKKESGGGAVTYAGTHLYQITSREALDFLNDKYGN